MDLEWRERKMVGLKWMETAQEYEVRVEGW